MFSLYVHSLFLHRFLWTVSSLSAFSAVSLYSIQSEAAFNWCKKKKVGDKETNDNAIGEWDDLSISF